MKEEGSETKGVRSYAIAIEGSDIPSIGVTSRLVEAALVAIATNTRNDGG